MKEKMNKAWIMIKINKKRVIIISSIILALLIGGIIIYNVTKEEYRPTNSDVFYIKDANEKYILYNSRGKRISKEKYKYATNFYNGISKVENDKNEFAVINSKGKEIVKFGEYSTINMLGGLFEATKDGTKKTLFTSTGEKLISNKEFSVSKSTSIDSFITVAYKDYYYIYSYTGKLIEKFKQKEKDDSNIPQVNEEGDYASVFYDGKNIIFNSLTGKIIKTFKDKKHYCVNSSTKDGSIHILNTCVAWYQTQKNTQYKYLNGSKLVDTKDNCDKLSLDNDKLVCIKDNKYYLLKNNNKPVSEELGNMAYIDAYNYAYSKDNDVVVITNGGKRKTFENTSLIDKGYTKKNIYLIYHNNTYEYINRSARSAFKNTFKKATGFDELGNAVVSSDGKDYYLINTTGKKISDYFDSKVLSGEYYIVTKNGKKGLLNKKGKVILENKYSIIEVRKYNEKYYAYIYNGKKYSLIDLSKNKEILTGKDTFQFFDNYIKTNNGTDYYTYTGKKVDI